jgi:hypothetical protein
MKHSAAEILREYGPFEGVDGVHGVTWDGQQVWFAIRRKTPRTRSRKRQDGALDRRRRPCRHRLRRQAFVPDRRGPYPEDRSPDRPVLEYHPGARRRCRLRPDLGRRHAVGGAISRAQDPPDRSREWKILRTIESNRFVTGVTWVEGALWHGTWENDESEHQAHRSANRRGAGEPENAGGRWRVGS